MIYLIVEGGHGKAVLESLLASRCEVEVIGAGLAQKDPTLLGRRVEREEKVLGGLTGPVEFLVAVPDGTSRRRTTERWEERGHRLVRLVHPAAWVSASASIGTGAVVMPLALVQTGASVEKGAIVDSGSLVEPGSRIGEFARLSAGARLSEEVRIGAGAWVGVGSTVREGVIVGERTVVGAGSVVVDDLPPDVVAHGNPCRVVRKIGRAPERSPEKGS